MRPNPHRVRPDLVRLETRDVPAFFGNNLFPDDSAWNQKITDAPVAENSAAIINRIVARTGTRGIKPDFGNPVTDGELYGIPITVVDASTPKVSVFIPNEGYADESDNVMVPIPANAVIEGDGATGPNPPSSRGDSHVLIYDKSANHLYELYCASRPGETTFSYGGTKPSNVWGAYQVSFWDLNKNTFRTPNWTSADAAGLPIATGLVRPDEAKPASAGGQGVIDHAIRVTMVQTRNQYVYPASHFASSRTDADLPRMGERFRLRADFAIPATWSAEAKAIAQAMKDYGLIVADNGSDFFFQGTPSSEWNMGQILALRGIKPADFQVVDLKPTVTGLSVTGGPVLGGTPVSIFGKNFSGAAGNLLVSFGGVPVPAFTVVSDSRIDLLAPPQLAGTVDVKVQSGTTKLDSNGKSIFFGYGTSNNTAADDYTYGLATSPPGNVPPPVSPPGNVPPPVSPPPTVPPPPLSPSAQPFAAGVGNSLRFMNADGTLRFSTTPFPNTTVTVRTATADFNGDGTLDVVAGTGPGAATRVRVLDGVTQQELFAVSPFEPNFTGGVYVAAGDVTGDGIPDLTITPDQGGGPRVDVFDGGGFARVASFFGIDDRNFRGGARASIGDINGDGTGDLVVVAGFKGGPRVAAFSGKSVSAGAPARLFGDFFAFEQTLRNGIFVTAGDVNGDGFADLIAGGGPGGGPRVLAFDGKALLSNQYVTVANFFAGDANTRGGVRLSVKDLDGDDRMDILAGDGSGAGSSVVAYAGAALTPAGAPPTFFDRELEPGFTGGVFVG
jgi:hypothetical protein